MKCVFTNDQFCNIVTLYTRLRYLVNINEFILLYRRVLSYVPFIINIDIPKNVQVPYYEYRRETIC